MPLHQIENAAGGGAIALIRDLAKDRLVGGVIEVEVIGVKDRVAPQSEGLMHLKVEADSSHDSSLPLLRRRYQTVWGRSLHVRGLSLTLNYDREMTIAVPLLDLKLQYQSIQAEIEPVVSKVMASQYFVLGPEVEQFEKEIAAYCGAQHAIGCTSGSDALLLALMAIGAQPGDEVLCPSYTFFATAGAIARIGVKPVFVDIDPVTFNMCPKATAQAAAKCQRLRAIMPVHLYGQAADVDGFLELGKRLGVPVIEDAAQAIGARDERGIGVASRCDIGTWSFFPSKNLGCFGDGGLCTTNSAQHDDYMRMARVHGSKVRYYHQFVGFNGRLDALQAAVLRVKLRHLEKWHALRADNAKFYDRAFAAAGALSSDCPIGSASGSDRAASQRGGDAGGIPLRFPWARPAPARHVYNQYVIRTRADLRDDLRAHLSAQKIGSEIYYPVPLHLQECFASLGQGLGSLPESELAAKETVALPIFPELTGEQRAHVAEQIISFLRANTRTTVAV